ncbi:tetratricopeptide repeat protein [Lachnoclostridium phytofermentans]|uniref:tetratricopeptide repeat protein n=1 Tax=Lachnoclostridium phytofermentans TaxID=66219 RepID=UPI0004975605|nr:tetratricopeptide repeat protein [Lachnoclostridium phytofermentans]
MKKKKVFLAVLCLSLVVSGCGLSKANRSYSKALSYYDDGEYEKAEESFINAIEANPDKAEYYLDYGFTLIKLSRYEDAIKEFQSILMEKEIAIVKQNNKKAYRGIGIAYLYAQSYEEAIKNFDLALEITELKDLDTDILYYKGNALERSGNLEEASKIYTEILEIQKEDAAIYNARANINRILGNYEESIKDYDKAIEISKGDFDLYFGKFAALKELSRTSEAEEVLKVAAELPVHSEKDSFELAKVYFYQKNYDHAKLQLDQALKNSFIEANYFLGEISIEEGDFNQAIEYFETFEESSGTVSAMFYNQLLTCYLNEEEYEKAKVCLKKAKKYSDVSIEQQLLRNEIILLEKTGDFNEAYEKIKKYLKRYPEDVDAQKDATFLKTRVEGASKETDTNQPEKNDTSETVDKP